MSKGSANGATLQYKNVTYIGVANVLAFDFPYGESEDVRVTTHNSTQEEFEPGIVDGGTITVRLVWDDSETSHGWLVTNLNTVKQFKYTAKDGVAKEFLAIIESISVANALGTGAKERTITLAVTDGTIA